MGEQYKAVIFDLDGTLIDSGRKLVTDVTLAFSRLGYAITPQEARKDWGSLTSKYGITKKALLDEMDNRKSWIDSMRDGEVTLFPDTISVLNELKSRKFALGLLTKSKRAYTDEKLNFFNLAPYFNGIGVVDPSEESKDSGALELVGNLFLNTKPSQIYFVGDQKADITVSDVVRSRYNIPSQGIFVDRNGCALEGYKNISSLDNLLEIV